MKSLDENDRLMADLLPDDPFEGAEPYDPGPESEPRRARPGEGSGARPARSIVIHDASEIAKPLPELSYLVPALGIASGAPVLVAGYGFSGKTVSLQSLALSVASGRPAWGVYNVRRGRVLHLDFEQGTRVTHERYQRLARGMGVDLAELGDRLRLAVNPAIYLDDADAEDAYSRAFEGVDLAIVDSLRAAAPRGDENASDVRRAIDLASRAAEKHGTVVVFIHHARKPKAEDPDGARYKIRGSSALFDAGGSVFVFASEKGQPTRVSHEKCRNTGRTVDDFGLDVKDVDIGGNARAGLRVVHLEADQLAGAERETGGTYSRDVERIATFLREQGEYRGSKTRVCKRIRMGNSVFFAAFAELESRGELEEGRDERGSYVRWRGAPDTPEEHSGVNGSAEKHSSCPLPTPRGRSRRSDFGRGNMTAHTRAARRERQAAALLGSRRVLRSRYESAPDMRLRGGPGRGPQRDRRAARDRPSAPSLPPNRRARTRDEWDGAGLFRHVSARARGSWAALFDAGKRARPG